MATVSIQSERAPATTAVSDKAPKKTITRPLLYREPRSLEQGKATYEKEKVLVAREIELRGGREAGKEKAPNKFSIQAEAEATLIGVVQDFVYHLDNPVYAATLEQWQTDFIAQFKKGAVPKIKEYEKEELHAYAEKFVRTNEGLIAALKVAEWKIALYQRATGAHIEEIQSHKVTVQPGVHVSGISGEVSIPERNVLQRLAKNIPVLHVGETSVEKAARKDAAQEKKRDPAEKDKNYYYDVTFDDKNSLTYHASGGNLTLGQVAYLRSVGIDASTALAATDKTFINTSGNGGRDASAEQKGVGDILKSLTDARIAVYQATGKFNINLNFVNADPLQTYAIPPEDFLKLEHAATIRTAGGPPPADVRVAIENQLVTATEELRKKNKEVARKVNAEIKRQKKEAGKKEGERLTVQLIEDQKTELSQKAPPVSPDIQQTINANTAKIAAEKAKVEELRTAVEHVKQIPGLKKSADEAKAAIPDFLVVEKINQPSDAITGLFPTSSVGEAEANYSTAQDETAEALRKLTEARKRQDDASRNLANLRNPNPATAQALIDINAAAQALDIGQMESDFAAKQITERNAKNTSDQKKRIQAQNAEKWNAYQNAQQQLESAVRGLNELAVQYGIPTVKKGIPGIPGLKVAESAILTVIASSETTIEVTTLANEKLTDPNKMAREHQRVAYEVLIEAVTPPEKYEAMQQRVDLLSDKKNPLISELRVAGLYADYPPVYLRALQVMFGWEIASFTNAAEFQRATKLLTPQMFLDSIDSSLKQKINPAAPPATIPITDPFDIELKDPNRMKKLSMKTMSSFVTSVLDRASKGELGKLSPAEVVAREDMKVRAGTDLFAGTIVPADRNDFIDALSKDIYHYEDVDDLARIIWIRHPTPMGTAQITNEEDAKAYAKEIVLKRSPVI